MTTPHAYSGEAILKGVTYSRQGGHCARFEIEPEGWEALKALDGAHFAMVLVPVANDGTPDEDAVHKASVAQRTEHRNSTPAVAGSSPAGGSKPKSRAQMAGILCNEPRFWKFLSERYDRAENEEEAAVVVRSECCVYSRSEFDTHPNSCGKRWDDLHAEYEAWLRT